MADSKLVEYIKASRLSGRTDREIRQTLTDIGWTAAPVDEAFREADVQSHPVAPETPPQNTFTEEEPAYTTLPSDQASGRGRLLLLLATVGLLLVFAIVGIFIAFHSSSSSSSSQNSSQRDTQRETDIKSYAAALVKYHQDHGHYPGISGSGLDSTVQGNPGVFDKSGVLKSYLSSFPLDPKNSQSLCKTNASAAYTTCAYKYRVSADGQHFILWTTLENSYNNEGIYTANQSGNHTLVSSEPKDAS